jgi:outer membrane receptor protein involved in Fe transport
VPVTGVPAGVLDLTNPAVSKGGELESLLQVTGSERLSLSLAYLEAYFTKLSTLSQLYISDTQIARSPKWQLAGSYQHRFVLPGRASVTATAQASYRSQSYVDQIGVPATEPYLRQPGYTLVDLLLAFEPASGKYNLTIYARNLTDVYYKTGAIIGADPSVGTLAVGIPRSYGAVLSMHF